MKGEVERARALWSDARQVYVDAGLFLTAATFAQGGAEILIVPGDHQTMHDPPHVDTMAERLKPLLAG